MYQPQKMASTQFLLDVGRKKKEPRKDSASGPPLIERSRRLEAILFILILRFLLFYSIFFSFSNIILYYIIYTSTYIGWVASSQRERGKTV
jgi:hypothetical protein